LEDARLIISVLLYILVFLFVSELKPFKTFFWDHSAIEPTNLRSPLFMGKKNKPILKSLAFIIVLAYAVGINISTKSQQEHSPIDGVWYSRNDKMEFFADGSGCIVKESGKATFYQLKTDSSGLELLEPAEKTGDPKTQNIKGHYFLIKKDSLEIGGRKGTDSIFWAFKRRKR
jgi:hypothetical protein